MSSAGVRWALERSQAMLQNAGREIPAADGKLAPSHLDLSQPTPHRDPGPQACADNSLCDAQWNGDGMVTTVEQDPTALLRELQERTQRVRSKASVLHDMGFSCGVSGRRVFPASVFVVAFPALVASLTRSKP